MARPPEIGDSLVIELELGARVMLLHGDVVHCSTRSTPGREVGAGIRFDRLDEADARNISEYVEARLGSVRL